MCMKHLGIKKKGKKRFPGQLIQSLQETNTDLHLALKLSLLPDTCPSTGSPLLPPHCCLNQNLSQRISGAEGRDGGGASRLTVQLVGSTLPVCCLGGQEKGLVIEIAVWGGRFVVRPEFSRAHVAAQGEQRLA